MAVHLQERPEASTSGRSPARRLRAPNRSGIAEHFGPTDPAVDLLRVPVIGRLLSRAVKQRPFQFLLILPNQIIFWLVITTGLFGFAIPTRNFATVITWYIWFCVVFLLMVGVGRGWCMMCPFGGAGEWVQRRSFWKRLPVSIGLHRHWPEAWTKWGILPSVAVFAGLTWAEEYFNIAGPGDPRFTGIMVLCIVTLAVSTFLIFDRRTFCRYLCPLTALVGTVGATGMVAGFRTRNRDLCVTCPTKDCMRGSERGYGCPWYEWPGSATSNLMCGLCTECTKNCPYDNVGLFVQKPLTSVIAPVRRRTDLGAAVVALFGMVLFQQLNALPVYTTMDDWLNKVTHFPAYPNPVDYVAIIGAVGLLLAGYAWLLRATLHRDQQPYSAWFTPLAYGFIPLVAVDYLARQLPKFWLHAPRIIPALSSPFAGWGWNLFGTAQSPLYAVHLLSIQGIVISQVVVIGIGTVGAVYATTKIVHRDMASITNRLSVLSVISGTAVAFMGVGMALLYVAMGGAQ